MEQVLETKPESVEQEATLRASKFFPTLEAFQKQLTLFIAGYKELRFNVVSLINEREHLRSEIRKSELAVSRNTEEAQIRLQNVESGHQAIVERLNKREVDLALKLKDIEAREAIATAKNRETELLRLEYERRLESMATIERQKSKAEKEAEENKSGTVNWPAAKKETAGKK